MEQQIIEYVAERWFHYMEERDILGKDNTNDFKEQLRGQFLLVDELGISREDILKHRQQTFGR